MRFLSLSRLGLALLLFAFAGNASGQTEPGDIVRINTDLVQTDVTVMDAHSKFVTGLKPEQFELRVDGKPVSVSFFEEVSKASKSRTDVGARKVVIFFDDLHLSAASVEHLRRAVPELLDGPLRGDEVAMVSASGQLGFLQQFTRHPAVLRAAVARLVAQPTEVKDTENPPLSEYVALRIVQGDKDALSYYTNDLLRSLQFTYALPKYGGKGPGYMVGSEGDQASRVVLQRAEALFARTNGYTNATLTALDAFLRGSARLPGRKLVLFFSDGFFLTGGSARLQELTDAATRAGAVLYPIDMRPLTQHGADSRMRTDALGRADKFSSDERRVSQNSLVDLAEQTGGRAILNADKLSHAVKEALDETSNYYLLAWRPETSQAADRFRQLAVGVSGRPELTVRFGRGYLEAKSDASAAAAKSLYANLGLSYLDTPDNGAVLTASTQVTVDLLSHGADGKQPAAIDLAGVVFNDRGKSVSNFKTRLNVEPPANGTAPSAVIYNHRAALAPGIYQVRVALRDERSGRLGHAAEWIEVPNVQAGNFGLSSLLLGAEMVEPNRNAAGQQMQFSVDRRFQKSSRLSFMLVAYNSSRVQSGSNLTAEISVQRNGKPVLTIPRQQVPTDGMADLKRISYGGSFPLRSLSAGVYDLVVTITDHGTKRTATQQIDFTVQ